MYVCCPLGRSIGLPDVHSGYGFAIGNMAAFDMSDPLSVVSPGGVGFDINCGVRLLRTNLTEKDVAPLKEQLAQSLFDHIPVGVGSKGIIPMSARLCRISYSHSLCLITSFLGALGSVVSFAHTVFV